MLVSGFNVYPNEVEDVIAMHPGVLECAVIGVPDTASGEAVKAFVVRRDPALTEDELKQFVAEQLTNYKRPKIIEFRDELPKTPVGKILRRALRDEVVKKESKAAASERARAAAASLILRKHQQSQFRRSRFVSCDAVEAANSP